MKTKPTARRHHYLPQAYLSAFTLTKCKDDQFFVLEIETGRAFRTSPLNVATQRDFNRVDIEGRSPDAVENDLAQLEGESVAAIRRVIDTQEYPNDNDRNLILNLIGLIAVRNPKLRVAFNDAREELLRRLSRMLASDRNLWEKAHEHEAGGEDNSEIVTFEDYKRFIEEEKYKYEFHPQGNLRVEFDAFNDVRSLLGQRTWSVLIAPPEGPEFICSDHPVTLKWKGGGSGPIGFGLKETEVFFPLGRRAGFYGVFERPLTQLVCCNNEHVATMNQRVAWNAVRHVYSAQQRFVVLHEGIIREVLCSA